MAQVALLPPVRIESGKVACSSGVPRIANPHALLVSKFLYGNINVDGMVHSPEFRAMSRFQRGEIIFVAFSIHSRTAWFKGRDQVNRHRAMT